MDAYYNYFYILMLTKSPDLVITRMHQISYSFEKILNVVGRLELHIDEKRELWGWNVYEIYKRMQKGFYLEAITRIPDIKDSLPGRAVEEPEKSQLEIIKNLLKADKEKNAELLKIISRVEGTIDTIRTVLRYVRERKYIQCEEEIEL